MVPEPYRYHFEYEADPDEPQYPYEVSYGGGGRARRRGGYGWLWVLIALLLLVIALIVLLSRYSIDILQTGEGVTVVVRNAARAAQPDVAEAAMGSVTSAPETPQPLEPDAPARDGPRLVLGELPGPPVQPGLTDEGLSLREIYEKALPSVVSITATLRAGSGSGTGIIMSEDGYIITNEHVVDGAVAIEVLTSDDQSFSASLVGSDSTSDLAVLRIEAEGLRAAEFGSSDQIAVGDAVVAIGDPLGRRLRGTMTDGIISAINRDLTVNGRNMTLIQTNAALNNGNSGGPLINAYGQVIGINTMKLSSYYTSATVEGLGFAIPISSAKPIIDELIEKGYVTGRPALGVFGKTLPDVIQAYYRLPDGVYVESVDPESDAYEKGIQKGDMIVAIEGELVRSMDDLNLVKNRFEAGDEVLLTIFRGGEHFDVSVVLMDAAQ